LIAASQPEVVMAAAMLPFWFVRCQQDSVKQIRVSEAREIESEDAGGETLNLSLALAVRPRLRKDRLLFISDEVYLSEEKIA
jgi:hypothetical protein